MKNLILISAVLFSALTFAGGSQGGGVGRLAVSFNSSGGLNEFGSLTTAPQGVFVYFVKTNFNQIKFVLVSNLSNGIASKETNVSIDELSKYPALESGLAMSQKSGTFVRIY
jgi:hypothetical protein